MPEIVNGNIVSTDEEVQAGGADALVREYLAGLQGLSIIDFGYAYKARMLALANGESQATILAIVGRTTAQQYITGLSQWQGLTAEQRAWAALDLEAQAYDAMVIRLILT